MKNIALSIPMYDGNLYYQTCRTILNAANTLNGKAALSIEFMATSATPFCFNRLLASAVASNADYWVLLHSDLGAKQIDWLPMMLSDMQAEGLSVLSAVAAIKDESGVTSTALDTREHFPRRLTLAEIHAGPDVLTNEKAKRIYGYPLLINTGMMVWDMSVMRQHVSGLPFEFHDCWRDQMTPNGMQMHAAFQPEDWLMSKRLNALNIPFGATKRVHTVHKGGKEFDSSQIWGAATDMQWVNTRDQEI